VIGYAGWSLRAGAPAGLAGGQLPVLYPLAAIFIAWFWLASCPAIGPAGGCFIIVGVVIVNVLGRRPGAPQP